MTRSASMSRSPENYSAVAVEAIVGRARDLSTDIPTPQLETRSDRLRQVLGELASPTPAQVPAPYTGACGPGEVGPPAVSESVGPDEAVVVDGLLVTNLTNVAWLTGFRGSAGAVWVPCDSQQPAVLMVDARYGEVALELAERSGGAIDVKVYQTVDAQTATLLGAFGGATSIGLEGAHVTLDQHHSYARRLQGRQLIRVSRAVEQARRRKDETELFRLARAAAIADFAFSALLQRNSLVGQSEAQLGADLAAEMASLGSDGLSFASIIASGPNSSRPHHEPGRRVVEDGDLVTFDFGAMCDGYHSDTTRTVVAGTQPRRPTHRETLDLVIAGQNLGVQLVRAGVHTRSIDAAIRRFFDEAGRGHEFVHGTGHGVGLEIHEEPWVGATSAHALLSGDVVTVEPGLYRAGDHGARHEDTLVVCEDGSVPLTRLPNG